MKSEPTPYQIRALVSAAWQCLDDMGSDGTSVCPAAKAMLRDAYKPFHDEEADGPLDEIEVLGQGKTSGEVIER